MISHLELRHLLESAFLPTQCKCEMGPIGRMTVHLINPRTQQADLTVSGIETRHLSSSRAIAALVNELKEKQRRSAEHLPDRRRHRR